MSGLRPPPRGFRLERCTQCALPLALCICSLNEPLQARTALHVILPRTETRSTTNTARLLQLWLPGQTHIEVIGEHEQAPAPATEPITLPPPACLLFPTTDAVSLDPSPSRTSPQTAEPIATLVVPDGTWSQARRLARRVMTRQSLSTCALTRPWPSCYTLRRRSRGLCTFEAVAIALAHNGELHLAVELLNRFHRWHDRAALLRTGLPPERCASGPTTSHPCSIALLGPLADS